MRGFLRPFAEEFDPRCAERRVLLLPGKLPRRSSEQKLNIDPIGRSIDRSKITFLRMARVMPALLAEHPDID